MPSPREHMFDCLVPCIHEIWEMAHGLKRLINSTIYSKDEGVLFLHVANGSLFLFVHHRSFCRLFYPTDPPAQELDKSLYTDWLPSKDYARGYAKFIGFDLSATVATMALNFLLGIGLCSKALLLYSFHCCKIPALALTFATLCVHSSSICTSWWCNQRMGVMGSFSTVTKRWKDS